MSIQMDIKEKSKPDQDRGADEETKEIDTQHKQLLLESERNDHKRTERFKEVFSVSINVLVVFVFLLIAFALLTVSWHYLAPTCLHWIHDEDVLSEIQTLLFSGILFGLLANYIRDKV